MQVRLRGDHTGRRGPALEFLGTEGHGFRGGFEGGEAFDGSEWGPSRAGRRGRRASLRRRSSRSNANSCSRRAFSAHSRVRVFRRTCLGHAIGRGVFRQADVAMRSLQMRCSTDRPVVLGNAGILSRSARTGLLRFSGE
jgi:hypothetical protein